MTRVAAVAAGRVARAGCAVLAFGLGLGMVPASAATLNPALLPKVEAATFEVVAAKPAHDPLRYAKPLPMDLIPYQKRTDKYYSIGTAFAIGPNRYVTAGHVLLTGLNSLRGPPSLRDASGHVYAIGKIEKFSLRKDFVVFSLKSPPKTSAVLPVNTHPALNQTVYAVGNALGTGIVVRDGLYTSNTPEDQDGAWKWLRFSAAASPGNSGGPLLDGNGKVIGVVLMKSPNENLNYALPIGEVLNAPAGEAVIDKRIPYGFPLFQDTHTGTFRAQFKLPVDLADFYAAFLERRHAYVDGQLKALLGENADTLFPHGAGSARLLYAAPTRDLFPTLLTRKGNGDWVVAVKKSGKMRLADNGFVRFGEAPGKTHVVLFHLRKPDNVPAAGFYGDPVKIMDLLLKSGFMTRTIATSKIRITSFGKPVLNITHTDAWQRRWRVMEWPIPFANSLWMVYALPVPDGYVGFFAGLPASREHDHLINLEAMTDFFYASYGGTLSQWRDFLKETKWLPAAFRHIHMDIREGQRFGYKSDRLEFEVTPRLQQIEADSRLVLGFSFFRDRGKVVWGVSNIELWAQSHGKDSISVSRGPNPKGDPNADYKAAWNRALNRQAPYDGVAYDDDGVTSIAGVAGGAAGTHPGVLYTVDYDVNGQHPQDDMKSGLDVLLQGLRVYEH